MKTILIVDAAKKLPRLVIDGLQAFGSVTTRETKHLIVKSASSAGEAVNILNRFKVDLVVADLGEPASDGFEFMAHLKQDGYREIPVIVLTVASSDEVAERLRQMNVSHHLKKPFVLLELLEKILAVLEQSSKALISDFTVPNFLQALNMEEKTCTLKITSKGKVGYLHMERGELIDAQTNGAVGNDAAIQILGWENTELNVEELSGTKRRIQASLMQILMQAAQVRDERADSLAASDSALAEIVALAESLQYGPAEKRLTTFLKANLRNHKGWLWYSRITNKIPAMEKSLSNARKLAPDDPEVLEEIRKVETANKRLQAGRIWRCPFCWSPLNLDVFECPYCGAVLSIDETLWTRKETVNSNLLRQAIDRFAGVVTEGANPEASHYLALAYLNLGKWEQGLDQLNNTVINYPEKTLYADQLHSLLNLLSSKEDVFAQGKELKDIGADLPLPGDDSTEKKTILLVENSPVARKVMSIALSRRGYDVIRAGDGLEALNRLDQTRPDAILMDAILPKIDAQTTLSIIRNNPRFKDTPVIILTNEEGLLSRLKRPVGGSTTYLPRPFELSTLLDATARYIC
jgi:twitching motility two-component system response regulator PilG